MGGEDGIGSVGEFEFRDGAPEAFEIVIAAGLFGKNVENEAAEIEQSPFGGAAAFAMFRFALHFLVEQFFDFVADGLNLRRAEAGANDEVLRERAEAGKIQNGNARGFLVLRGLNSEAHALGKRLYVHRLLFTCIDPA